MSVKSASVLDTLPPLGDGNGQTSSSDREGKLLRLSCSASGVFCRQRQMIKD